jgi:hypothetical protein
VSGYVQIEPCRRSLASAIQRWVNLLASCSAAAFRLPGSRDRRFRG